jgi:hypothetical protein
MWKKITTDTNVEPDEPWHTDQNEVVHFGGHLIDHAFDARDLQHYYESPWKWTSEHDAWAKHGKPEFADCDCLNEGGGWGPIT